MSKYNTATKIWKMAQMVIFPIFLHEDLKNLLFVFFKDMTDHYKSASPEYTVHLPSQESN